MLQSVSQSTSQSRKGTRKESFSQAYQTVKYPSPNYVNPMQTFFTHSSTKYCFSLTLTNKLSKTKAQSRNAGFSYLSVQTTKPLH